jgi:dienelactone hydrolase
LRKSTRAFLGLFVTSILLAGCVYYGPKGSALKKEDGQTARPIAYFHYIRDDVFPHAGTPWNWGLYQVQPLRLPMSINTGIKQKDYHLFYYRPKGQGPFPAVVILPITRGDYFTQRFAVYLAERGYACLRFESTKNFTDDSHKTLQSAERLLKHYVIDVRRAVDWLLLQEEVDPNRLGIMGISLGAIVASVVMEADPRFKAGVFLLGGGDLAGIIDTSTENSLVKFRQRVLDHEGLDAEGFQEAAKDILRPVDPLTYASRLNSSKILMINGYFDEVIRREYVKAFWQSSGQPELVFIPTGHYSAGLLVTYARAKTEAHFNQHLR